MKNDIDLIQDPADGDKEELKNGDYDSNRDRADPDGRLISNNRTGDM